MKSINLNNRYANDDELVFIWAPEQRVWSSDEALIWFK